VDDSEQLRAWASGDQASGDALILRYFDSICRFFRSKVGDDVDDLLQRTFLDLLESAKRSEIQNVRATLYTIAHRRLLDQLRAKYRGPVDGLTSLSVADLGTSPSSQLGRNEEQRLLHDALRRISLEHQVVLELAYWEELPGAEIAVVLGIAEPTVRSRLARAREALRAQLTQLAETPALAQSTLDAFTSRAIP
jgi:RNA polymerase sigma-70 factor (ECF subfamily)